MLVMLRLFRYTPPGESAPQSIMSPSTVTSSLKRYSKRMSPVTSPVFSFVAVDGKNCWAITTVAIVSRMVAARMIAINLVLM